MKYKLIKDNDYINKTTKELKEELLHRRQINNVDNFLNVSEDDIEDYNHYDHMELGYNLLLDAINNKKLIGILIDVDVDGYSSGTVIYKYIKDIDSTVNIIYFIHSKKQHGLTDKNILAQIKKSDIELLIIPDASSNDYIEHKKLKEIGIDILVLDHHEAEKYSDNAVTINNQLSDKVNNKCLSGVGVVYKFCKYIDNRLNVNYTDKYLDLVALGNIGDVMDLRELETRYLVLTGLKNINNKFLIELINKNSYEIDKKGINILSIGWTIVPKINAVIRMGTKKDKVDLFRAFIEEEEISQRTYKGKTTIENLQQKMSRIAMNKHQTQNNNVKKVLGKIEQQIDDIDRKILIFNGTEKLDNELTGLIANKLASKYKRPILMLQKIKNEKGLYGGSARNYKRFNIKDLRQFCLDSKLFDMCEGHANAFGIKINQSNIELLKIYIQNKLHDIQIDNDNIYDVDYIFNFKDINSKMIIDIGKMQGVWGNGIDEPYFIIKNVIISNRHIKQYGSKKNVVKFTINNIDFVKEYASKEFFDKLTCQPERGFKTEKILNLDILGKFKAYKFNNRTQAQIQLIDYNLMKAEEPDDIF